MRFQCGRRVENGQRMEVGFQLDGNFVNPRLCLDDLIKMLGNEPIAPVAQIGGTKATGEFV